ncbi:hypothetical protein YTPLAS73_14800 [Nitrosarchaeum sp.]|nr:hypothetical protein YTPLAS73_14800 [Nitrosarchaeum sp.]
MSLQLKLTLQKIKTIRNLVLISAVISAVVLLLGFVLFSCGVQHISIINDLKSYDSSYNPDFCDGLVERINLFNDDCEPKVEIIDCG